MKIVPLILSAYHNSSMKDMTDESIKSDIDIKVSTSIILSITSLLLSVFNVANHSSFMLVTTVILTVGFAACAVICGVFRKRELTVFIMSVLIGVMFTVYAIIGVNDGFAILWMLFVPLIGMSLIGLRAGTVLSAYFQFFLIAFFYAAPAPPTVCAPRSPTPKPSAASVKGQYIHGVSLSVGRASVKLFPVSSIDELEKRADEAMYVEKSAYYEAHGLQKRF